jgi:nicotinate phosphoribosyltransferase
LGSSLLTDLYQVKMMYAHWKAGTHNVPATFDLFFRTAPHGSTGAVTGGVCEALEWLTSLRFAEEDIAYLRTADAELCAMEPAFFDEVMRPFRFTGDVDAILDGTRVFPREPILRVTAPICQAQYVESALLAKINSMTLIGTKAARIVHAAAGAPVIEMGLRRGQGEEATILGAKAAYQAGVTSTSNLEAGKRYGIPVAGTNAHAWFQFHGSDRSAMLAWARAYQELVFVIDTYDTLRSGLPGAMWAARESGKPLKAVRLDSGDLAYLSKQVRAALDAEGFTETKILASSDLDEFIIQDLRQQGAPIDIWGVGTQLITGGKQAALDGVYKLSAVGRAPVDPAAGDLTWEPRIKLSDAPQKVTLPGRKQVVRFFVEGMMAGDVIMLEAEPVPSGREPYELVDPLYQWKRKLLREYTAVPLLEPVVRNGRLVHPELQDCRTAMAAARQRCQEQSRTLWAEYRRLLNPEHYPVDLSPKLLALQQAVIAAQKS